MRYLYWWVTRRRNELARSKIDTEKCILVLLCRSLTTTVQYTVLYCTAFRKEIFLSTRSTRFHKRHLTWKESKQKTDDDDDDDERSYNTIRKPSRGWMTRFDRWRRLYCSQCTSNKYCIASTLHNCQRR
jgi:hypothetical protein